jgi:hypothetical protein
VTRARAAAVVAAVLLVLLAAGCGGDGDDGRGSGPGGLPADFPVPEGADARFSMAGGGGLAGGVQVELTAPQPPEELRAWYAERLPAAGYAVEDRDGALEVRGHDRVGVVTVAGGDAGGSTVRVMLEPA